MKKIDWKSIPIKIPILKVDDEGIKILGLFRIKPKKNSKKTLTNRCECVILRESEESLRKIGHFH